MSKRLKATKTKMYQLAVHYLEELAVECGFTVPVMRKCCYKKLYGYRDYILDFNILGYDGGDNDLYVKCYLGACGGGAYMRIRISVVYGQELKHQFINLSLDELSSYDLLEDCA